MTAAWDDTERAVARRLALSWNMDPDDDENLEMVANTMAFHACLLHEQARSALGPLAAALERVGRMLVRWQDRIRRRHGRTR